MRALLMIVAIVLALWLVLSLIFKIASDYGVANAGPRAAYTRRWLDPTVLVKGP